MHKKMGRWLSLILIFSLLASGLPGFGVQRAEARVSDGIINVDGSRDAAWDQVQVVGTSANGGWQGFQIDNLRITNDRNYLYYWIDAVNVPNWGEKGQYIDIALNVNGVDSSEVGNPLGGQFDFSGTTAKPQFHIVQRVKNDHELYAAQAYASAHFSEPILSTESDAKGAAFAVDRTQGFEGKIPLDVLNLKNGDTVKAIVVLSGNNASEHGAFDVIAEDPANQIADSWNESGGKNVESVYSGSYQIHVLDIAIDGQKDEAWEQVPVIGRSENPGWNNFRIDNLRMTNDGTYLYYWVDAVNVDNWGDNGLYIDIALNVNDADSGVAGNPLGAPFRFASNKPQFHIIERIKQDHDLHSTAVYSSNDFTQPILSTETALKGAEFAVDRTKGFEGKIPLGSLGLDENDRVKAIVVLSGNNASEHGAFDVIVEDPANQIADSWDESLMPNEVSVYSDPVMIHGVIKELRIANATPGQGAANVPILTHQITIQFNDSVIQTVYGGLSVTGAVYTVTVSGDTVTFDLQSDLEYGTTYQVNIPAKSLESNRYGLQQKDLSYTFTVEPDPLSKRYIYFYYDRPDRDYKDWDIWVWSSGISDGAVSFTDIADGQAFARVPVASGVSQVGFKVRKGNWEETDVDFDRYIMFAPGQATAKVVITSGVKEIKEYEHVTGPVLNLGKAAFFYRDEMLFRNNEMHTVDRVNLVLNGEGGTKSYRMTYVPEQQYFTYIITDVPEGITTYQYEVTRNGVTSQVNDYYNPNVTNGKTYFEYMKPGLGIAAGIAPNRINDGENAVLSVHVTGDKSTIKEMYADLTLIGGAAKEALDSTIFAQTISVDEATTNGVKSIPITVIDKYGNHYGTTVNLEVTAKRASGKLDFDWDENRVYFILTDRFFNGDPTNDDPNGEHYDTHHLESYHGGDFQGIMDKLDYLEDLGINTIWITPIVDNIDFNVGKGQPWGVQYGYHGYWAKDFTKIDEHLGDLETFKALIDKAHDRGIKVMVDVVLNHTGYGLKTTSANTANASNYPTDEDRARFDGMLRTNPGNDDVTKELADLPDFMTEDPAVRAQIIEWQSDWLNKARTDRGDTIDFFRVDTVKNVDHTTWKAFKNALIAIDPNFKMIGEYFGGSMDAQGGYLGNGQMDSLLDFDFKTRAREFSNGQINSVETYLEQRNSKISSAATLGQFLSSHDEDGFLYSVDGDISKLKIAAALQITAKGQPVIYYGEELGRTGQNANFNPVLGENRGDMPWDQLEAQADLHDHYKKLLHIRAEYSKVFSKGTRAMLAGGDSDGYLVFERTDNRQSVIVGINTTDEPQNSTFNVPYAVGTQLVDQYNGVQYTVNGDRKVNVSIPAKADGGTMILAAGDSVDESDDSWGNSSGSGWSGSSKNSDEQMIAADLQTDKDGKIVVDMPGGMKSVLLPANEAILDKASSLVLQGSGFSIEIPAKVLGQLQSMISGTGRDHAFIEVGFAQVRENELQSLLDQAMLKYKTTVTKAGDAYEFILSIAADDGTIQVLHNLNAPVIIRLQVNPDVSQSLTGIYYVSDDGKLEYIDGRWGDGMLVGEIEHLSKYAVLEYTKQFDDVSSSYWAAAVIQQMAARQIIAGTTVATFEPERPVTRAEFTAMLVRALGLKANELASFRDINASAWYAKAVAAAYRAGIVQGKSDTIFAPDDTITREEMAVMAVKASHYRTGQAAESAEAGFLDQAQISGWAEEYVNQAVGLGLIVGIGDHLFDSKGVTTRATSAQVISRLLKW